MTDRETVFEIHRMHLEGMSNRRIARNLKLNRKTVARYLQDPHPSAVRSKRPSKLDPFKEQIDALLEKDPSVSAVVVKQKLEESGFVGGVTIVKDYLKRVRKKPAKRAFLRFESAPGQQMQLDWGHFGALSYDGTRRKLYGLVFVEGYSRMLYVEFFHSQKQESLHRGIVNAFRFFGGSPKELVVDNMAAAVVERCGSLIRFNDAFLDFLLPFKTTPVACNVRSPQEKGKVESAVKYVRRNFMPLRDFVDLADVQRQAMHWLETTANRRTHQGTGKRPCDRFRDVRLTALPEPPPEARETLTLTVHNDFAVRFDGNAYTVPPWAVGKQVALKADSRTASIYLNEKRIAVHERSYKRKERIETPHHREQVRKMNRKLWRDKDIAVFASLGPEAVSYLQAMIEAKLPIKKNVAKLLSLKDEYGASPVLFAVRKAAGKNALGADYIENILRQEMKPKRHHLPVKLKDKNLNRIRLKQPSLSEYDAWALKIKKDEK